MDYQKLRRRMVEEQLIPRGIKSPRVLDAFYKVERHRFVSEELQEKAYSDFPLPIGQGQTISQPYIVALMTQSLDLHEEDRVLEIGTGSGYQTAILAELAQEVYSIERKQSLAQNAESLLKELGYTTIDIKVNDGTHGWQEKSPFDKIIVTAASPLVPLPLTQQLKESGKLIIPLEETMGQMLTVVERKNGILEIQRICGCVFVPLIGTYGFQEEKH